MFRFFEKKIYHWINFKETKEKNRKIFKHQYFSSNYLSLFEIKKKKKVFFPSLLQFTAFSVHANVQKYICHLFERLIHLKNIFITSNSFSECQKCNSLIVIMSIHIKKRKKKNILNYVPSFHFYSISKYICIFYIFFHSYRWRMLKARCVHNNLWENKKKLIEQNYYLLFFTVKREFCFFFNFIFLHVTWCFFSLITISL